MNDAPAAVLPEAQSAVADAIKGFLPLAARVKKIHDMKAEADRSDQRVNDVLAGMNIERADGRPETWPNGVPLSRTRQAAPRPAPAEGAAAKPPRPQGLPPRVTKKQVVLAFAEKNGGGFHTTEIEAEFDAKKLKKYATVLVLMKKDGSLEAMGDGFYKLPKSGYKRPAEKPARRQ